MGKTKRIITILYSLLYIIIGIVILINNQVGYFLFALLIGIILTISSLKNIIFYFLMARHMIGGRKILYKGLISLDVGVVIYVLLSYKKELVIFFLILLIFLYALMDLLRYIEIRLLNKKIINPRLFSFIFGLIIAILCIVFHNDIFVSSIILGCFLILLGISKAIPAFKTSAWLYYSSPTE